MAVPPGCRGLDGGGRNHDVADPAGVLFVDAGAAREPHDEEGFGPTAGRQAIRVDGQRDGGVVVRGRFGAVDSVIEVLGVLALREDAAFPIVGALRDGGGVAIGGGGKRRGNRQKEGERHPGEVDGKFPF